MAGGTLALAKENFFAPFGIAGRKTRLSLSPALEQPHVPDDGANLFVSQAPESRHAGFRDAVRNDVRQLRIRHMPHSRAARYVDCFVAATPIQTVTSGAGR